MIYFAIIIVLLFLSVHYDVMGKTRYKNAWYYTMLVAFVLLAGLRYRLGVDTSRYMYHFYHDYPDLWQLESENFAFGQDPLYVLLNSVIHSAGGRFYMVQLIQAAIVNTLIFRYFKKHTPPIFTCVLLYFLWKYFSFNMEEMRASISVAICLYANDFVMKKEWLKGFGLFILGCGFHSTTAVIMITPLLFFLRFNKLGLVILAGAFVAGGILQLVLGDYLYMLEFSEKLQERATGYVEDDDFMESKLNIIGLLTKLIPYIYASIMLLYVKFSKKFTELRWMEPLMMICLIFVFLYVSIPITYRFLNFYAVYAIICISNLIVISAKTPRLVANGIGLVRAFVISLPLVLSFVLEYKDVSVYSRFYPYSSVIEMSLDGQREKVISGYGGDRAHHDEY